MVCAGEYRAPDLGVPSNLSISVVSMFSMKSASWIGKHISACLLLDEKNSINGAAQ